MAKSAVIAASAEIETRKAGRLNPNKLDGINQLFRRLDLDGSGDIAISELRVLWRIMFPELHSEVLGKEVDTVFSSIDVDGDGKICWEEMVRYLDSGGDNRPVEMTELLEDDDEEVMIENPPNGFREWLWAIFEHSAASQYTHKGLRMAAAAVQVVITIAILLSVLVMMIESLPALVTCKPGNCEPKDCKCTSGDTATQALEAICIAVFTIEFVCRTSSTPDLKGYCISGWTWVDILSILPFYCTTFGIIPEDSGAESLLVLRVIKIARLSRILRMLRLGKQFKSIQVMLVALQRARMAMVMMCVLMLMTIVFYSSVMYYVERRDAIFDPTASSGYPRGKWIRHPDSIWFKDAGLPLFFQSIPDAMWWGLATVTTVGYGDVYPVTPEGKTIASLTMVTGILVVSYPITILTNAFATVNEEFREEEQRKRRKEEFRLRLYAAVDCDAGTLRSDPMMENSQMLLNNGAAAASSGGSLARRPSTFRRPTRGRSIRQGWTNADRGVSVGSDQESEILARLQQMEQQQKAFQEEVLRRLDILGAPPTREPIPVTIEPRPVSPHQEGSAPPGGSSSPASARSSRAGQPSPTRDGSRSNPQEQLKEGDPFKDSKSIPHLLSVSLPAAPPPPPAHPPG